MQTLIRHLEMIGDEMAGVLDDIADELTGQRLDGATTMGDRPRSPTPTNTTTIASIASPPTVQPPRQQRRRLVPVRVDTPPSAPLPPPIARMDSVGLSDLDAPDLDNVRDVPAAPATPGAVGAAIFQPPTPKSLAAIAGVEGVAAAAAASSGPLGRSVAKVATPVSLLPAMVVDQHYWSKSTSPTARSVASSDFDMCDRRRGAVRMPPRSVASSEDGFLVVAP